MLVAGVNMATEVEVASSDDDVEVIAGNVEVVAAGTVVTEVEVVEVASRATVGVVSMSSLL